MILLLACFAGATLGSYLGVRLGARQPKVLSPTGAVVSSSPPAPVGLTDDVELALERMARARKLREPESNVRAIGL